MYMFGKQINQIMRYFKVYARNSPVTSWIIQARKTTRFVQKSLIVQSRSLTIFGLAKTEFELLHESDDELSHFTLRLSSLLAEFCHDWHRHLQQMDTSVWLIAHVLRSSDPTVDMRVRNARFVRGTTWDVSLLLWQLNRATLSVQ